MKAGRWADAPTFVKHLKPPIRELVEALRQLVLKAAPDIEEAVRWGQPVYSRNGLVCFIKPATAHVTLGFYRGAELADPQGLFEGAGTKMRHVKVRKRADMRQDVFMAWVREAVALNQWRKGKG